MKLRKYIVAHWIDLTNELWKKLGFKHYRCSACGADTGIKTKKCFRCEAEMDMEEK